MRAATLAGIGVWRRHRHAVPVSIEKPAPSDQRNVHLLILSSAPNWCKRLGDSVLQLLLSSRFAPYRLLTSPDESGDKPLNRHVRSRGILDLIFNAALAHTGVIRKILRIVRSTARVCKSHVPEVWPHRWRLQSTSRQLPTKSITTLSGAPTPACARSSGRLPKILVVDHNLPES
jgi:hypothetical protein